MANDKKTIQHIFVKVDQTKLSNKMHFDTQLTQKASIYKPKREKEVSKESKQARMNSESFLFYILIFALLTKITFFIYNNVAC